jgi:hypothetical protein
MKTTLKFERDTKGTHVYKNDEDDAPIPSLYVKKTAFKKGDPPKTLTIEIAELK